MSTWKSYTGGKLSNGAHAAYHQELVSLMEESTAATLHIDTLFPAYKEAVEQRYRFFSFGDAMFIC